MATSRAKVGLLVSVWFVTACAADIATKSGGRDARLVRRVARKNKDRGVAGTMIAQVQPHGTILSPERAEHSGDGDLEGGVNTYVVSPSGLEESSGAGETREPLSKPVSESTSKTTAWGSWVQGALASLSKTTNDDAADDEALQSKLKTMKKSQLMGLGKDIGIAMELIKDANDEDDAKSALVKLLLDYKASHQNANGKRSKLMRMVTSADGDTQKIGKPSMEDIAKLDNVERPSETAHEGKVIIEHRFRGCFPLPDEKDLSSNFHDLACMKAIEGEIPCRGGLPFFRLPMAAGQSYLDCFTFCLHKGLDLSGIVSLENKKECRCGATVENVGAWHRQEPKEQLLLRSEKLKADDPNCKLLVWEYTGGLTEDDSVPYPLLQMSEEDRKYMENVATGRDIMQEQGANDELPSNINVSIDDANVQPDASLLKMSQCKDDPTYNCEGKKGQCRSFSVGPTIRTNCPITCGICTKNGSFPQLSSSSPLRRCYPHNCAGGGGPWLTKRSDGNAYINYFFRPEVDNARKQVFQRAIQEYHSRTCIRWVYSTQTPRISVGIYDIKMCTASVGYPGQSGTHIINLGWCKDMQSLAGVIHEMGHSVGMNHEQNRVDGPVRALIDGQWRGPYLNVHWQNIASDWRAQYVPIQDTYVGSAYDGTGDHHWGYQTYDFRSIMHYYRDSNKVNYDTIPTSWNSVVGRGNALSSGDLRQINDMYQCGKAPPTPTPPPGPCNWWCRFQWTCRWPQWCGGCPMCRGGSLFAKEDPEDDDPPPRGAPAEEPANNEDPEDDIAVWVADAWGACKRGKIICERSRQIVCESPNGKEVKESKCDPSQKPSSNKACYCSEITEVPKACAIENPKFGNKPCDTWRHGLDCFAIDPKLPASCPRTCGLC